MNYWEVKNENTSGVTEAWIQKRKLGIGGSEIAIIMGKSPYRTAYSLWLEKTARKAPDNISALPHVQRGIIGEKACRLLLERKYMTMFSPKSWELGEVCRCNDDGYSLDRNWILEIKCMGAKAHEAARPGPSGEPGVIPEHYRLQCQWNLMISGADKCLFVSYRPEDEDMVEIEVLPDIEEHKILKTTAERWWEVHVVRDMAPALSTKDYVACDLEEYVRAAKEFKRIKGQIAELELLLEKERKSLSCFVTPDIPAVKGAGIKVSRTLRKGAVDYKSIRELSGVDLEAHRKPSQVVVTVHIEGESDETT